MDRYKVLIHYIADKDEKTIQTIFNVQIVILQRDDKYYKLSYFGGDIIGNIKYIHIHSFKYFSLEKNDSQYIYDSLIGLEDIVDYLHKII